MLTYLYKAVMFQVFKHMTRSVKQVLHEKINLMDATTFTAIDILYYKDLVLLVELWIDTLPEN